MTSQSGLTPGDTIGVVALSSACRQDIIDDASKYIEKLGFKIRILLDPAREYGKDTFLFSSDSAEKRAGALQELYQDDEVRLIASARGAYGSMEILPLLDWELLRSNPKPLVGFSDTTVVLNAVYRMAGLTAYHGPSFSSLSPQVSGTGQEEFQRLLSMLSGATHLPFGERSLDVLLGQPDGEVSGVLIGGNLTLLAALVGTPWAPVYDDAILFFEDIGVRPYALHRLLLQMKLAGCFSGLKGVIVGGLHGCEHVQGLPPSATDCIKDIFGDQGVPVYSGAPIGHKGENSPLPIGATATIDADNILRV